MKGIEELYDAMKKHFIVLEGHLDDKDISKVFQACRLKPYDMFLASEGRFDLKFHSHWIDEYGNSLHIKNKKMSVIMNDLLIDRSKIQCSDLYDGLPMWRIASISRMIYATKDQNPIVAFWGFDNYLRVFIKIDEWKKCSPLLLDMKTLHLIVNSTDINYAVATEKGWMISLPVMKEVLKDVGASFLEEIIYG